MQKIKRYIDLLQEARKLEGENVPVIPLVFKMFYWILVNHGRLLSFLFLGLHKKNNRIRDYVNEKDFRKIHHELNSPYYLPILEDKYICDRFLRSFGFPLAESIGLLENGIITWIPDRKTESLEGIVHYNVNCYCKMILGWGGSSVYKLEISDGVLMINNKVSNIEELKSLTHNGIYILQKTVVQHDEMSRLNPSCVNTVRIITIHDGKIVHAIGSFLRIGVGDSPVDNISSGNLACGIHENGTLYRTATNIHLEKGWLTKHPTTNTTFASFTVPYFKDALELARQMHKAFHCFFIVAWDIAITETGPVVIECNPPADIIWIQAYRGGLKKEFLCCASGYRKAKKKPYKTQNWN
jgi:Sugar-transfer associated ATP-grasp